MEKINQECILGDVGRRGVQTIGNEKSRLFLIHIGSWVSTVAAISRVAIDWGGYMTIACIAIGTRIVSIAVDQLGRGNGQADQHEDDHLGD